ncbi:hypothetical protein ACO0LG_08930 [Undibacterium sp. Ji42W]|uniref:hypothetical protein n=1 Tax=Undibacterium sp. Ji42W TaxID=3413039 RepID=UPI003BF02D2C
MQTAILTGSPKTVMPDLIWQPVSLCPMRLSARNRKNATPSKEQNTLTVHDQNRWMLDRVQHDGLGGIALKRAFFE